MQIIKLNLCDIQRCDYKFDCMADSFHMSLKARSLLILLCLPHLYLLSSTQHVVCVCEVMHP